MGELIDGQWRDPNIRPTIDFDHIKKHYFGSHRFINPTGIVPVGPDLDFTMAGSHHEKWVMRALSHWT